MSTLYASFVDPESAERAAAALLDHGARSEDLSILANEQYRSRYTGADLEAITAETTAKSGITTTTPADAGYGAAKGTAAGLGVGILGALAALFVPGVGLVIGGGALAAAVGAAVASAAAGAAVGGVAGYLKDQGVGEEMALRYHQAIEAGGAVLAVATPSGEMSAAEIEPYLVKYGAVNVVTYNTARSLLEPAEIIEAAAVPGVSVPVVTHPIPAVELTSPAAMSTMTTVPASVVEMADVRPTLIDPVTGTMREGVAVDPLTGFERPVRNVDGMILWADQAVRPVTPATLGNTGGFTLADITPTQIDPVSGVVTRGTVVDPVTGGIREVRVLNGAIVYADVPTSL